MDRPDSAEKWSSSEGEVDIYYKMSDDEELKRDDWNARNNNKEEHGQLKFLTCQVSITFQAF